MRKYLRWAFAGALLMVVPLYALAQGTSTSPVLNEISYAMENEANDISTATTSDRFLILDVSDTPDALNWGDGANVLEAAGVTATAAEINMAADSSANTEIVTTTNVIAAGESGTTYILNTATAFVTTLPAPAAGLRFTFVVGATIVTGGNHTIVTNASGNVVYGNINVAGAVVLASAEDSINLVADLTLPGDILYLISDGTNWYVSGMSSTASGITFTAT